MKILHVIHRFPPYYMAGSEVYTYNLCKELALSNDVWVFTRIEDPYLSHYQVEHNSFDGMNILRVNKPSRDYTFRSKYIDKHVQRIFEGYLKRIQPEIVHLDHLSHLSTTIVDVIKDHNLPIVFTLHDYWMICARGQLIRNNMHLCEEPKAENCARCFASYFLSNNDAILEMKEWENQLSDIRDQVDVYIAPSRFLQKMYVKMGVPKEKIMYLDYGFNVKAFEYFEKKTSKRIRFGFLGRIIPVKGVDILIDAFNDINAKNAELNIYGEIDPSTKYLERKVQNSHIHFRGPYKNWNIADVLAEIDVLVVPSIWYENSPLVIHEAFLAKIPVIASDLGGMAELVQHGKNGLLFRPRDVNDLRSKMETFINEPELIKKLSPDPTQVRTIQDDAASIMSIYKQLLNLKTLRAIYAT